MPIEISEVTVAAGNNKIYAIGGTRAGRVDHQLNHEYDIARSLARAGVAGARHDSYGGGGRTNELVVFNLP